MEEYLGRVTDFSPLRIHSLTREAVYTPKEMADGGVKMWLLFSLRRGATFFNSASLRFKQKIGTRVTNVL